jgi:hypothetical protein
MSSFTRYFSKKYTFALITIIFCLAALLITLLFTRELALYSFIAAIVSTQASMALIGVTYLTGQAKVDISAVAQAGGNLSIGKKDQESND